MEFISLIPTFGSILYTIAAFVIALSAIVAVHEYGHYIVGRWSGIQAEVFSIGFGPVLFSREDQHGTRWQIAALPFGGYVRFLGDSNAASGKDGKALERLDPDSLRHTMHGAPLWARTATVAAGPIANFIMAIVVFTVLIFARGVAVEPPTVGEMMPLPAGLSELQEGDRILALNGQPTPDFDALYSVVDTLPVTGDITYRLERDGQEIELEGPYPLPPRIESLQPGSPAMQQGLQAGDVLLSLDGQPLSAFTQVQEIVSASDGRALSVEVWRDGETLNFELAPRRMDLPLPDGGFETRWLIGMTGGLVFEPATRLPGVLEAAGYGVSQTWFIMRASLSGLYHMITGAISSCNLSGPLGIAETSGAAASQGVLSFVWFIAMLSTAVGLLNLFPIPVLDGGHLVFYGYEAVSGRPPSDRALRAMMAAGLALLLSMMVFALFNDLFCP